MSQPNRYLEQNMRNSTPYVELTQEVIRALSSKIKNGKALLTFLRELSVYSGPNQGHNDGLARALITAIKDNSTQDIDRKIVRTSYFLLSDMVCNTCNADAMKKISTEMIQHLLYETKQANGSRLCMVWRLLSRMVFACESEDLVEGTLINTMKTLKYPEKEKRFINQKKANLEFENQLHFWTAIFSSIRRIRRAPPAGCIQIIFTGCRSSHVQLARHSFYLLKASLESHPYEVGQYFLANLKDGSFLSRASTDVMSCVYLMEGCKAFIMSTEADRDTGVPSVGPIEDTLIVVFKMLEDNRMKVRVECVRILTEIPQGPSFKMAVKNIGGPDFLLRLTNAVLPHLQKLFVPLTEEEGIEAAQQRTPLSSSSSSSPSLIPIGFGEVNLFPLCRACIRIGRYMVLRESTRDLMSSASDLIAEETRLENIVRPLGQTLANLARTFVHTKVYLPHARCEVLKALLWMMPDNRGRVPKHNGLWSWLQSQILSAIPLLGEDLSENLINHIFGRVKVSTFYPEDLLELAVSCAEQPVRCFVENGGNFIGVLIQVWQRLHDYREHAHARLLLLRSLLRAIDTTLWSTTKTPPIHSYTSLNTSSSPQDYEIPIVSHQQGLLSLRHFAYWALGEYVQLWDTEEIFKNNTPLAVDGLCLQSVFFNVSAAINSSKQSTTSTQSQSQQTNDISMFFGSTSSVPFQDLTATPTPTAAAATDTPPVEDNAKEVFIPPLVSVVLNLFHAIQVESSSIITVCLESLFKIALWCPLGSPLRQIITDEFHEISASPFGVNFPFLDQINENSNGPLDLFQSPYSVDPRSVLSTLDRMGLSSSHESPFSPPGSIDPTICQFNARKFGNEWHESLNCRESSLYSLALESLSVAKDPPQFNTTMTADIDTEVKEGQNNQGGANNIFLGFDFLGDPIPHHQPPSQSGSNLDNSQSHSADMLSTSASSALASSSNFVVDGIELKKLFYQLDQKAIFNI